jgi:hypothetical protein
VSNLSFINSSLTLVSAGADNVMHVWDAARATLLGTLDLQEPGTHLDGWKYTVVEDEEMQKAAVTQEVSGRSLTGDSASRTLSRQPTASRVFLMHIFVVICVQARKLLLSTKELHRLAKKRKKALKKKLKGTRPTLCFHSVLAVTPMRVAG